MTEQIVTGENVKPVKSDKFAVLRDALLPKLLLGELHVGKLPD
jgi:hypothetical protein